MLCRGAWRGAVCGGRAVLPLASRRCGSAVAFQRFGSPSDVLSVVSHEAPSPKQGEVRVKMLAAPITHYDMAAVRGVGGAGGASPSGFGGNEGIGQITDVGSDVSGLSVGDLVVPAMPGLGTWRTELTCKAGSVRRTKAEMPFEYGASMGACLPTAVALLECQQTLAAGDVVVQNIGTSSVGQCVVQVAAMHGIKTINIVNPRGDSEIARERLKLIGGDLVVDSDYATSEAMQEAMHGSPALLGLNGAGGQDGHTVAQLLGQNANLVTYANTSGRPLLVSPALLVERNIQMSGFNLHRFLESLGADQRKAFLEYCDDLIVQGKVQVMVERHPFADFGEAVQRSKERFVGRKVVMMME